MVNSVHKMAESGDPVASTSSNEMQNSTVCSAEAGVQPAAPVVEYHATEFWKKLTVGAVPVAGPATVLAATKDLCRHFVSQEDPVLLVEKAAKLAAQTRRLDGGPLTRLLVDHAGLQQLFTLDPDAHLDIEASSWDTKASNTNSKESFKSSFTTDRSVDDEDTKVEQESTSTFGGLLYQRSKKEPLTICSGDSPDSPLRLSFSDKFLYTKADQPWLEDFLSSVDELTETQALVFGPAFATLFLVARMAGSDILWRVSALCSKLTKYAKLVPAVAQMVVADLKVKIPPQDQLRKLLPKYCRVKLAPVLANTVLGGFVYAEHNQGLTKPDVNYSILEFTNAPLYCYQLEMFRVLLLFRKKTERWLSCSHIAHVYLAFVEQTFPESWKAFRRASDLIFSAACEFGQDELGPYSRVFSPKVLDNLSYRQHYQLCNISAVVHDLLIDCTGCVKDWPQLGPYYQRLRPQQKKWMKISRRDAVLAENLHWLLLHEMGESIPDKRVITPSLEDSDSADVEAGDAGSTFAVALESPSKPFVVTVESPDCSSDVFLLAEKVRAFEGYQSAEIVGQNRLKVDFDNVYQAVNFLLATANSSVLRSFISTDRLFCYGIIRHVPKRLDQGDLLKELWKTHYIESVHQMSDPVDGEVSRFLVMVLQFWGTELPPYVVYKDIRIPVEPRMGIVENEIPN